MSDNVIQFAPRSDPDQGDGLVYCPCGDAWWRVAAVNFRPDLTISGWTGRPVCNSCSQPMP